MLAGQNVETGVNKDSLTDKESLWTCDGLQTSRNGGKHQGATSLYFIVNKLDERLYFKCYAFKHVLHLGVDSIIFPRDEQVNLSSFQMVSILITEEQWDAKLGRWK